MRGTALVPLVALLLGSACSGPARWRYEESLERTPAPAAHAVHEERLVALMRGLDRLQTERLPQALDRQVEAQRQARRVAEIAEAVADSAARIPAAAPAGLGPVDRKEFVALAAALERQAHELAQAAPTLRPEEGRARLSAIDATCVACHSRFRIDRGRTR